MKLTEWEIAYLKKKALGYRNISVPSAVVFELLAWAEREMQQSLFIKLASIVVHADEATGPQAHPYDVVVLRKLLEDLEIVEWLKVMGPLAPVKRISYNVPSPRDGKNPETR